MTIRIDKVGEDIAARRAIVERHNRNALEDEDRGVAP
jgi:hypothetical protein